MTSTLGPAFRDCRGVCPDHRECEGKIRQRYLVDWRPGLGPKPDLECDVCGAWFDIHYRYLRHDPIVTLGAR